MRYKKSYSRKKPMAEENREQWKELLAQAIKQPGKIHECYTNFWDYSFGNCLTALFTCSLRGIQSGPIASYKGWQKLGRQVKKGEKAISLCMPVPCKFKTEDKDTKEEKEVSFNRFVWRPFWFVLSQTEGEEFQPKPIPGWDENKALGKLEVTKEPFSSVSGNTMGYAHDRIIAINPFNPLPHKTTFHELAHIVLGHCAENPLHDNDKTPKNIREVEAESVAYLCTAFLQLPGLEYSRGYIQSWLSGNEIPEKSAQKIFHATDTILKAGIFSN